MPFLTSLGNISSLIKAQCWWLDDLTSSIPPQPLLTTGWRAGGQAAVSFLEASRKNGTEWDKGEVFLKIAMAGEVITEMFICKAPLHVGLLTLPLC